MTLFADNFLTGALLTILVPTLLLIAISVFLHWVVARVPTDISPAATAPPPPEMMAAAQAQAPGETAPRQAPGETAPRQSSPADQVPPGGADPGSGETR